MKSHLFKSDSDGALYDTRDPNWSRNPPLRANYNRHHRRIKTVADLKATLRAGRFTDLGGYPLYFVTSDGAVLSFEAARSEFRYIVESITSKASDGWRVVACDINYEDAELYCDHTNALIPSAYGE